MVCSSCGANVPDGDFCPECGAKQANKPANQIPNPDRNQGYANSNPNQGYANSNPNQGYANANPNQGYANANPNQGYANANPNQGYANANPNQGYGNPNQGYGNPNMGYGNPNMGYGNPNMGYGNPNMGGGYPNQGIPRAQQGPFSYFDGTGAEYLGMFLVNSLLLGVTCGFAIPWVVVRNLQWRKSHTFINGRKLAFTGTTAQLMGNWIKWWLLSLVTCGIYSLWVSVRMKEWEMIHTCYEDMLGTGQESFADSFYDGTVGERLGVVLVARLLIGLTCGIYTPWAQTKIIKFDLEHSVINGDRLGFKGTGAGYWGENAIVGLLCLVTCGFYMPWGIVRINKWTYKNTFIQSIGNVLNPYR